MQDKLLTYQKILIIFVHPAMHKSRMNRELIKSIQNLPHITFHDLYEVYPDFYINVDHEQNLLKEHDIIVFMHPFFWYSAPSLLKEWQDLVLEHGFAYGSTGIALRGKKLLSVITTAGNRSSYDPKGYNRYQIQQLLSPFNQTAYLCGMRYLPPIVFHGVLSLELKQIQNHAKDLRDILIALRDNRIDFNKINENEYLNVNFKDLLTKQNE